MRSTFTSNAALKGAVIYCDHCTASFDSSEISYNVALQASIVYLKSVTAPGVNVVFTNASLSNGFSVSHGGGVATEGQYAGMIKFLNTSLI